MSDAREEAFDEIPPEFLGPNKKITPGPPPPGFLSPLLRPIDGWLKEHNDRVLTRRQLDPAEVLERKGKLIQYSREKNPKDKMFRADLYGDPEPVQPQEHNVEHKEQDVEMEEAPAPLQSPELPELPELPEWLPLDPTPQTPPRRIRPASSAFAPLRQAPPPPPPATSSPPPSPPHPSSNASDGDRKC